MTIELVEQQAPLALLGMTGIRKVAESKRMGVMPRYFGIPQMIRAENQIYNTASRMCREYRGGMWDFYTRKGSDALIWVPSGKHGDDLYTVRCEENGWESRLPPDAAGIVVCLFAYCAMSSWCDRHGTSDDTVRFAELYHALKDVACDHPLRQAILQLID